MRIQRHLSKGYLLGFMLSAFLFSSCEKETEYIKQYIHDSDYYKAALEKLDWGTETTYAIGHKTPDMDAVCSAITYADLMKRLGYNCEARMAGEANNATKYASETLGFALPSILPDASGKRLILMDHNEYLQAVQGAANAKILQIIDHHGMSDVKESCPLYCKFLPLGATCTIVYQSYEELGVSLSDDMAKVLLAGILDDTSKLTKAATTKNDSIAVDRLMKQLGMVQAEADSLYKGMNRASRNFYGMTDTQIFNSDMKDYIIEGHKLRIGSLDWYVNEAQDFNNRMLAVMPQIMEEEGLDMIFAKVDKHIPNPDYGKEGAATRDDEHLDDGCWILYYGILSKDVAEQASQRWNGTSEGQGIIRINQKLSRKTDIKPAFEEVIQQIMDK